MSQKHLDSLKSDLSQNGGDDYLPDVGLTDGQILAISDEWQLRDGSQYDPADVPDEVKTVGVHEVDGVLYIAIDNGACLMCWQLTKEVK